MEAHEQHNAPRGQKTPPPGMRPAPLSKVAEPQGAAVTIDYVAAAVPLGSPLRLQGGDDIDGRTVRFLLEQKLPRQRGGGEEARRRELEAEEELGQVEYERRMRGRPPGGC